MDCKYCEWIKDFGHPFYDTSEPENGIFQRISLDTDGFHPEGMIDTNFCLYCGKKIFHKLKKNMSTNMEADHLRNIIEAAMLCAVNKPHNHEPVEHVIERAVLFFYNERNNKEVKKVEDIVEIIEKERDPKIEAAKLIISRIVDDINCRYGIGKEWESIGEDFQEDIKEEWKIIIAKSIEESGLIDNDRK